MRNLLILLATPLLAARLWGGSYYTVRPDDPKAVYLTRDNFPVHGDGLADDTDAIQQAINKVQETTNQGVVFVPEGRYRLTNTVYIWPGIRLIGYGAARPVFVLGERSAGYRDKDNLKYMLFFSGGRGGEGRGRAGEGRGLVGPAALAGGLQGGRGGQDGQPRDAGAGTFYSAISNIDIEIQDLSLIHI